MPENFCLIANKELVSPLEGAIAKDKAKAKDKDKYAHIYIGVTVDIGFTNIFETNLKSRKEVVVNIGGARSSKSHSLAQLFIYYLTAQTGKMFGIARKTMPALRMTAMKAFIDMLSEYGIYSSLNHNKSANYFEYNKNRVQFFSLDQPDKIKSTEFNYLWMEEANEFTKDDFLVLSTRMSGKCNGSVDPRTGLAYRNQIFLSLNPSDETGWIPSWLLKQTEVDVIRSTWRDNPFLSDDYTDKLERLRHQDLNAWRVYCEGEWGRREHIVYSNYSFVDEGKEGMDEFYGLDFGFNNPSALVQVNRDDSGLYVRERLYVTRRTNSELIDLLNKMPDIKRHVIYCDAAEPQRIEELCRAGFVCKPAVKEVVKGIDTCKSQQLFITKDSANLIKEITDYSWRLDKNGNPIDEPVKFNDHCFAPGTMVETISGTKAIENIENGDFVLTRFGFMKVLSAGITNTAAEVSEFIFSDGTSITATPSHRILANGEFTRLQDLTLCDTFTIIKSCQNQSHANSTELPIDVIPIAASERKGFTTEQHRSLLRRVLDIYTGIYGSFTIARYLRVIISITKTATHSTMISRILKPLRRANIYLITERIIAGYIRSSQKSICGISENLLKRGIEVKRGGNGIGYMLLRIISGNLIELSRCVKIAIRNTMLFPRRDFVLKNVNLHIEEKQGQIISNESANSVESNSLQINFHKQNIALKSVQVKIVGVTKLGRIPVYNLTVENHHEYFANGVLVKNCLDAMRYAVHTHIGKGNGSTGGIFASQLSKKHETLFNPKW